MFTFTNDYDKTFTMDEGAKKCDTMKPQTQTSNWNLDSNNKILSLAGKEYIFISLSSDELSFSETENMSGTTYTLTYTYGH